MTDNRSALFLLFIQYAAPESTTFNDETFATVKAAEETKTIFNWPKVSWIFVFQYPIVEILCVILQEITEASGRYCLNSLSPKYAHVWVEVIETLSIGPCVFAILAFRSHLLRLMRMKRALGKIISFKIIVFIRFVQTWAFSLLLEYHVIKPSSTYSYNDILYGIPAVLTCAEMVIFSLGFWYAFSSSEYSSKAKPHAQPLSLWSATLHALNPWDLISGIGKIFPFARELSQTGDWTKWRAVQVEAVKSSIKGGGLVGKGIRKYKNRKGPSQGRYQELDEGVEPLTRPIESHHQDGASYPMGGLSGSAMYQPPEGSPWDEPKSYLTAGTSPNGRSRSSSQSYLAAAQAPPGRPRASSQSSLMMESSDPGRLQEWNGLRYDRTPSPSEGGGYFNERTQGRDTVDM